MQDINAGGISSEGLLEQLEDRNDEDYSEYLEILEETAADPILVEPEKPPGSNDPQQDTAAVSPQDTAQGDLCNYVQEIQSKYRKIRPKQTKSYLSMPKMSNAYSILRTNNANAILDTGAVANSIILTSPGLAPIASAKRETEDDANEAASEVDYEQGHETSDTKSSIELFFASMAQTVKKLPPKAQADIKMNICKIVTEAEVRYAGQGAARIGQQFVMPCGAIPKLVLIPCSKLDNQNGKD